LNDKCKTIDPRGTDRTKLRVFLLSLGGNIEKMNIILPRVCLEKGVGEIIEGQVREVTNNPLLLIE